MIKKRKRFPVGDAKFENLEQGSNKTELLRGGNRHGRCKYMLNNFVLLTLAKVATLGSLRGISRLDG